MIVRDVISDPGVTMAWITRGWNRPAHYVAGRTRSPVERKKLLASHFVVFALASFGLFALFLARFHSQEPLVSLLCIVWFTCAFLASYYSWEGKERNS